MLTLQRKRFCELYLKYDNASKAYREAGYSENGDRQNASILLQEPEVAEYITRRQAEIAETLEISTDKLAKALFQMGTFDIRTLFDEDGNIKPISEWDDSAGLAVMGVEVFEEKSQAGEENFTTGYTKKVKVGDKRASIDSLAKMLGHNAPDKVDHTTKGETINAAPVIMMPSNGREKPTEE